MPDSTVATDSQEAPATPQGTEAPANDLAQAADSGEGAKAAPVGFDEEWLAKLDPASRQTFEEKFIPKPVFTQKTQALAEEKKKFEAERAAIFELARKAIADRPVAPSGPTAEDVKRKELLDLATAGDGAAMQQLIQMEAARQIQPIQTQVVLQNAVQAAQSAPEVGPYVREQWNSIVQEIQTSPLLARLASVDNNAGAQAVMEALGYRSGFHDRGVKLETAMKEIEGLKAKLTAYERERAAGLPSSTTRAGTTAGRPVAGETQDLNEISKRAWLEAGGTEDSFR